MSTNLKVRNGTYYAVMNVPRPLREKVGRNELLQSLKTNRLAEANARKWGALKALHERLDLLMSDNPERHAMAEAILWRSNLRVPAEPDVNDRAHDALRTRAEELSDNIGPTAASRFYRAATGEAVFLKDHLDAFVAAQDHATHQSRAFLRSTVNEMLKHLGESLSAGELTRRAAGDYVVHLRANFQKKTVRNKLTGLSCYWDWLMERGLIENNPLLNPWKGHKLKKSTRAGEDEEGARRMWSDSELAAILSPTFGADATEPERGNLPALARLGVFTGARIEDICGWKADMVERDEYGVWINNKKGKTKAAARLIPVHPAIVPLVERLAANPDKDGYLLHDLRLDGADKKRSKSMSRQFSLAKRAAGVTDDGAVFHSLRNTVCEHLEGAEVSPATAKVVVGHKRGDITYGLYSKGLLLDLQTVIKKLRYSDKVMALV